MFQVRILEYCPKYGYLLPEKEIITIKAMKAYLPVRKSASFMAFFVIQYLEANMYFTNKDLTLMGIISALGLGLGFVVGMPTRAIIGLPFLGSWIAGPLRVLLTLIALARIKKVGCVTCIESIYSLASFFKPGGFPLAFFAPLIGGLLTDLAFWVIKGKEFQLRLGKAAVLGGILNLSKPLSAFMFMLVLGLPGQRMIKLYPLPMAGLLVGSLVLGILAGALGAKIAEELSRIGLLT